ncbi:MAG: hypothetical protein GX442_00180 [Candidatus Riflebacteria bacterium]|nr:hypothetical protein [Candidatus Riflebacteria bacterium]
MLYIIVIFGIQSLAAAGWQFLPEPGRPERFGAGEILVIDPDDWGRAAIGEAAGRGALPLAWIDVSRPEAGRACLAGLPEKDLFLRVSEPADGPLVTGALPKNVAGGHWRPGTLRARFYLEPWREALRRRVREVAHQGAAGLFLAGTDGHRWITDHAVGPQAMVALLTTLARDFRALRTGGVIILLGDPALAADPALAGLVDGVALEGLWYGPGGRTMRPWDRARRLAGAADPLVGRATKVSRRHPGRPWGSSDVVSVGTGGRRWRVLAAEQAETAGRVARLDREAAAAGIDVAVASLPLTIRRKERP